MTQIDWNDDDDGGDFDSLKRSVDLAAAGLELGIDFEDRGHGRYTALCPFHDDHDPSLDIYVNEKGCQRFNCRPCGIDGDLFDLVERRLGLSTREALEWVEEHREQLPPPPEVKPKEKIDFRDELPSYDGDVRLVVELFYQHRPERLSRAYGWIINEFGLRATRSDGALVIPHFGPNREDDPVYALRLRYLEDDWSPTGRRGNTHEHLYGIHRLTSKHTKVLLVEGESDTWAAAWWLRDRPEWCVLGLPSGAGQPPKQPWLDALSSDEHPREITVMFDSDDVGRRAAKDWVEKLLTHGVRTRVGLLPNKTDVGEAGEEPVLSAADGNAREMRGLLTTEVLEKDGFYAMFTGKGDADRPITDFTVEIEGSVSRARDGLGTLIRVRSVKTGIVQWLYPSDWASNVSMKKWAAELNGTWSGTGNDAGAFGTYLLDLAQFAPVFEQVTSLGLHGKSFVLGDRSIGEQRYVWVPGGIAPMKRLRKIGQEVQPVTFTEEGIYALLNLQPLSVSTPVIGWFAAAFARSRFHQFPILNVYGISGSGKTTFMDRVADAFQFHVDGTLAGGMTPHALKGMATCSCGVPVLMDEYHGGDISDKLEKQLHGTWRAAWEQKEFQSAGGPVDVRAVDDVKVSSPMAVIGEQKVNSTSVLERSVLVRIRRDQRGTTNPFDMDNHDLGGLGEWWATRIVEEMNRDFSPHFGPFPEIPDRSAQSLAVARWGYEGFANLLRNQRGILLPAFDASQSAANFHDASQGDPVLDPLRSRVNHSDGRGKFVFTTSESGNTSVYINLLDAIAWAKRSGVNWPTTTAEGLADYLSQHYETQMVHYAGFGEVLELIDAKDDFTGNSG